MKINYNFGQFNRPVKLVGHSLGGIIIRNTMYLMQENSLGGPPFPTTIGHVTDAITFNTPHSGTNLPDTSLLVCSGCTQAAELSEGSNFMSALSKYGQNPQISGGFTDWTVIGSECDTILQLAKPPILGGTGIESAVDMHASHAVVYSSPCYDHGGAIHDESPNQDAHQYYCDTADPDNPPCGTEYKGGNWVYRENGPHGLLELYNSVTGRFRAIPSGAKRVGSSRRLWLLSTIASAWALLRR